MSDTPAARHAIAPDAEVGIEVIDFVAQSESESPERPVTKELYFERADILDSGWVRCENLLEEREGEASLTEGEITYYPPQRVNRVFVRGE